MPPLALLLLLAPVPEEQDAVAAVQKLFDGIAARDATMIGAAMLPGAQVFAARDQAVPSGISVAAMAKQIAASKVDLRERFTSPPPPYRSTAAWHKYGANTNSAGMATSATAESIRRVCSKLRKAGKSRPSSTR